MNTLHPIFAAALQPFAPPQSSVHDVKTLIPRSSFNDDDLYVYDVEALQLIRVYSCRDEIVRRIKHGFVKLPTGQKAEIGLSAKYLGLWGDL